VGYVATDGRVHNIWEAAGLQFCMVKTEKACFGQMGEVGGASSWTPDGSWFGLQILWDVL